MNYCRDCRLIVNVSKRDKVALIFVILIKMDLDLQLICSCKNENKNTMKTWVHELSLIFLHSNHLVEIAAVDPSMIHFDLLKRDGIEVGV